MKILIIPLAAILMFSGCISREPFRFMLTNTENGHKLGPFKYHNGSLIDINEHTFKISQCPASAEVQVVLRKLKESENRYWAVENMLPFVALMSVAKSAGCNISFDKKVINSSPEKDTGFEDEFTDDEIIGINNVEDKTISFTFKDVSAFYVLNHICKEAGYDWEINESVINITLKKQNGYPYKAWEYNGDFNKLISLADRIVIRDGGFDCCGPVDKQKILFEIKDPKKIAEFNKHIQFEKKQTWNACMCCGYPGIDWYKGDYRLALTALQHGYALRWKDFPGDAAFTKESSIWLAKWMIKNKIPDPHNECKKLLGKETVPEEKTEMVITDEEGKTYKIYKKEKKFYPKPATLNWLKSQQNKDGTWGDKDSRDVLTPLALLAFIYHNETPGSKEHGETVQKGIIAVVERIDDTKRKLPEPAKTISIWCLTETYAATRIPLLKVPLDKWVKEGDFDFENPWTLFALKASFCYGIGNEEEMQNNFKKCLKSLKKIPLDNLLNLSTVMNGYGLLAERKEKMQLLKKFWELSPEEWGRSEKPIFTALNISMMLWGSFEWGSNKKYWKWYQKFRKKMWDSQIRKNDMGWWTEKSIGIDPDTKYAFPNLSEDDKQIYIASIIIISIHPDRWLPTFKVQKINEEEDIQEEDDLGLKLE